LQFTSIYFSDPALQGRERLHHLDVTLDRFPGKEFTSCTFVEMFRQLFPSDWETLTKNYGHGGRDNGSPYGPNNYIGIQLKHREKRHELQFVRWVEAPDDWGNGVVALWKRK
jgi:hypothetical protein